MVLVIRTNLSETAVASATEKNRCLGKKCSVSQQNNFNISNYIMIMIPGCTMLDQRFPEYYKTKCKKLLYHNS